MSRVPIHDHSTVNEGGKLKQSKAIQGGVITGDVSRDDPFFVDGGTDGSQQLLRFQEPYSRVSASDGVTGTADSYIELTNDGAPSFNLFSYDTADATSTLLVGNNGSIVEVSNPGPWETDVDGTEWFSKHYLVGGWGLVLPILASDPATSGGFLSPSEHGGGQVYYNSTSKTMRWYDGTVWADVGTGTSAGGGMTPVVGYAESNGNHATSGTPGTQTDVPFDTFYDVNSVAGSLPAGLSLTYASNAFTATEDGVWIFHIDVSLFAAPGSTGILKLATPDYQTSPTYEVQASGNPADWLFERTVPMHSGDVISLAQSSTGTSVNQINGYALLAITRIANAVS